MSHIFYQNRNYAADSTEEQKTMEILAYYEQLEQWQFQNKK